MTNPRTPLRPTLRPRAVVLLLAVGLTLGFGVVAPPQASAATLTVNATDDLDDEVCNVDHCSLREAINAANSDSSADTIDFDIPGDEPHTIQLTEQESLQQALPPLWRPVTIDATTQGGYIGAPVVELVGEGVDGGQTAFTVSAANVQVSGLSLRNFGEGVRLVAGATSAVIQDNQFGTTLDGSATSGVQQNFAIGAFAGSDHTIDGNLIANANTGIFFDGGTTANAVINGNSLGLTRTDNSALPVNEGITLDGAGFGTDITSNVIAGHLESNAGISTTGTGGVTIAGNSIGVLDERGPWPGRASGGIVVGPASTNLSITANQIEAGTGPGLRVDATSPVAGTIFNNRIRGNDGSGIEITGDQMRAIVSQNDVSANGELGIDVGSDIPDGVNQFPDPAGLELTAVTPGPAESASIELRYNGLGTWSNDARAVELALNSECDASGFGEAESHLGSASFSLDENGDFSGVVEVPFAINHGDIITAQLPGNGDTGSATELSNCVDTAIGGNSPPTAQPDSVTTPYETPVAITLIGNDADSDNLTFAVSGEPVNGTTGAIGIPTCGDGSCSATVNFTPASGFSGSASLDFTVSDGFVTSAPATVAINVGPEPAADLAVSLADAPDPVTRGGSVAAIVTVKNLGPSAATDPVVYVEPQFSGDDPPEVTVVSSAVTGPTGEVVGSCVVGEGGSDPSCTFDTGEIPASPTTEWTITVVFRTSAATPTSLNIRALASATEPDPVLSNNYDTESTAVTPAGQDQGTTYVPPGATQPTLVTTAPTVEFNGKQVPAAMPDDTVAGAIVVPPNGPGGVVSVNELDCEPPFCLTGTTTRAVPTPSTPPVENRVIQFAPPTDPYYDEQHPLRFRIYYDASVVEYPDPLKVRVLYAKDSEPDVLLRARRCGLPITADTTFPCVKSKRVLTADEPALFGDLRIVLLATYNDPKAAGFR